jgi:3-methylcrotonyl-CoA carboxylase alpha subunit
VGVVKLVHDGREHDVDVVGTETVRIGERQYVVKREQSGAIRVDHRTIWAVREGDTRWVFVDGRVYEIDEPRPSARRRTTGPQDALTAPMPATVRRIAVAVGDTVKPGDSLIVLEAMKMELPVRATQAGTVKAITCREGELVQPGVPLIELEASS